MGDGLGETHGFSPAKPALLGRKVLDNLGPRAGAATAFSASERERNAAADRRQRRNWPCRRPRADDCRCQQARGVFYGFMPR